MKNLVIASEYRKLRLLHLLYTAERNYSKKELANKLHCSIKTLDTDINALQELFDPAIAYVHEDEYHVLLDVGEQINFSYLYAMTVSNSYMYLISKDIFSGKRQNLNDWAEENFSSLPTTYRRLRQIDTYLAESRLVLETTPLDIKGTEIRLRFYYFQIYSRSYPYTKWPFPEIPYAQVNAFIETVERCFGIYFSLSARINYAIAIAICLSRFKQGYAFSMSESDMESWKSIAEAQREFHPIDYTVLEDIIGSELPIHERYVNVLMCFWTKFSYVDEGQANVRVKYSKRINPSKYQLAEDLMKLLSEYQIHNSQQILAETIDFLTRFLFIDKMNILPAIPYTHVAPDKNELSQQIRQILNSYETNPNHAYIRSNKAMMIHYLTDFYNVIIQQEQKYQILHVKIVSENGYFWEEFLRTELRRRYSEEQIIICDELHSHEHMQHIDLIISDFPFYEETGIDADLLVWNMPPAKKDFEQLDQLLTNRS
ncbi:HTH domain-containing protein [Listeria weihenstephanensis]|uniref:HTH domain-containing protein n=1 Tax=Listeria weihenstephanensis TaxID=1006155 RepID=A0A841Z9B2_9LIST|nr:helix-turn-helix domain-containing protein [Listeria weihenstephanensis]MBC1501182.1 HTH domain-containing protein [Listeria weihenstephanensis]